LLFSREEELFRRGDAVAVHAELAALGAGSLRALALAVAAAALSRFWK
jgi:hypothetical protein